METSDGLCFLLAGGEGPPEGAGRPADAFHAEMVGPVWSAILCGLSQACPGCVMMGHLFLRVHWAFVHLPMAKDQQYSTYAPSTLRFLSVFTRPPL